MPKQAVSSLDVYAVVERLMRLRDFLHQGPHDIAAIMQQMPDDYTHDENGKRQLRRDIRNLEALGYRVERLTKPVRWSITAGAHLLAEEDVHTLMHIREAFADKHPLARAVRQLLDTLTSQLTEEQRKVWQRRPALRVPLNPAIDYTDCEDLIRWLEAAIDQRQQIAFRYRARGKDEPLLHPRLDPYDIEFTDRHFYLSAFSYRFGSILSFRIDRIVCDPAQNSPERLRNSQQPRREPKPIAFTYRLPASFADGGVSERFTIHSIERDGQYVFVKASDTSEFRIIRVLLGYGEHALLVDGPPTLMAKMKQRVMLMCKQYED